MHLLKNCISPLKSEPNSCRQNLELGSEGYETQMEIPEDRLGDVTHSAEVSKEQDPLRTVARDAGFGVGSLEQALESSYGDATMPHQGLLASQDMHDSPAKMQTLESGQLSISAAAQKGETSPGGPSQTMRSCATAVTEQPQADPQGSGPQRGPAVIQGSCQGPEKPGKLGFSAHSRLEAGRSVPLEASGTPSQHACGNTRLRAQRDTGQHEDQTKKHATGSQGLQHSPITKRQTESVYCATVRTNSKSLAALKYRSSLPAKQPSHHPGQKLSSDTKRRPTSASTAWPQLLREDKSSQLGKSKASQTGRKSSAVSGG